MVILLDPWTSSVTVTLEKILGILAACSNTIFGKQTTWQQKSVGGGCLVFLGGGSTSYWGKTRYWEVESRHKHTADAQHPQLYRLLFVSETCARVRAHKKKVPVPQVEEETTLPFPEQSISQSDKSLCYIYPTKAADDILTAARCRRMAHAAANHTASRGEGEQDLHQAEESTETFVFGEDNIFIHTPRME